MMKALMLARKAADKDFQEPSARGGEPSLFARQEAYEHGDSSRKDDL